MTERPERAWNSTLPRGKGFQPRPHWKGYQAGNSLAGAGPRPKTVARDREYGEARAVWLASHPLCVFPLPAGVCGAEATDCHHRESRGVAPDRVVDPTNFVSLCREHHDWVTTHPEAAEGLGMRERSSYELRLKASRQGECHDQ